MGAWIRMVLVVMIPAISCDDDHETTAPDVSGIWVGVAYDSSDIPEQPDAEIVLNLRQTGAVVEGTIESIGAVNSIVAGSFIEGELTLLMRSPADEVETEFSGIVRGDRVEGEYVTRRIETGDPLHTAGWFAERRARGDKLKP